jgi:hypothetical protein
MLSQWDESGNEIVVLAKKMCMMMMDMSDFTRYALYPSGGGEVGRGSNPKPYRMVLGLCVFLPTVRGKGHYIGKACDNLEITCIVLLNFIFHFHQGYRSSENNDGCH